jgi:hypothetical protein
MIGVGIYKYRSEPITRTFSQTYGSETLYVHVTGPRRHLAGTITVMNSNGLLMQEVKPAADEQ